MVNEVWDALLLGVLAVGAAVAFAVLFAADAVRLEAVLVERVVLVEVKVGDFIEQISFIRSNKTTSCVGGYVVRVNLRDLPPDFAEFRLGIRQEPPGADCTLTRAAGPRLWGPTPVNVSIIVIIFDRC